MSVNSHTSALIAVCLMSVDQGGIYVEGIGTNSLVLSAYRGGYTIIYIPSFIERL